MSNTEGLNTASTRGVSSTDPRVPAVPALQTSEILAVLRLSIILDPEMLYHSSKTPRVRLVPAVPRNMKP